MTKFSLLVCLSILAFAFVNGILAHPGAHVPQHHKVYHKGVHHMKGNAKGAGHKAAAAGSAAGFYELTNGDCTVKLCSVGASLASFIVKDGSGKKVDVVLGYDTAGEYAKQTSNPFGSIIGRFVSKISGCAFKLKGMLYKLTPNDGKNIINGGAKGFSQCTWNVASYNNKGSCPSIIFTHESPDGEEGFPGTLSVSVNYTLLPKQVLSVKITAETKDKPTPVNIVQLPYWNLGGHDSGSILDEEFRLFGQFYTPLNAELIPTGQTLYARGTAYDFTEPQGFAFSKRIHLVPGGYDVNYILENTDVQNMKVMGRLYDQRTKLKMEMSTNAPGLKLYTGDRLGGVKGKGGVTYNAHAGVCLSSQWCPDFINHLQFPQAIVEKGKPFHHNIQYNISVIEKVWELF